MDMVKFEKRNKTTYKDRLGTICHLAYRLSKILSQPSIIGLTSKDALNQENHTKIKERINKEINEIQYQLKLMSQTQDNIEYID